MYRCKINPLLNFGDVSLQTYCRDRKNLFQNAGCYPKGHNLIHVTACMFACLLCVLSACFYPHPVILLFLLEIFNSVIQSSLLILPFQIYISSPSVVRRTFRTTPYALTIHTLAYISLLLTPNTSILVCSPLTIPQMLLSYSHVSSTLKFLTDTQILQTFSVSLTSVLNLY